MHPRVHTLLNPSPVILFSQTTPAVQKQTKQPSCMYLTSSLGDRPHDGVERTLVGACVLSSNKEYLFYTSNHYGDGQADWEELQVPSISKRRPSRSKQLDCFLRDERKTGMKYYKCGSGDVETFLTMALNK